MADQPSQSMDSRDLHSAMAEYSRMRADHLLHLAALHEKGYGLIEGSLRAMTESRGLIDTADRILLGGPFPSTKWPVAPLWDGQV
jgi:hypothetical protein